MSHHHHAEQHEPRELAAFLKANTRATHQSVDDLVMSVQPFSTPENYTRFLQLQAVFHKIVDDLTFASQVQHFLKTRRSVCSSIRPSQTRKIAQ